MNLKEELKKVASDLKSGQSIVVGEEVKGVELLKKIAAVKIATYNLFLPKTR